MAVNIDVRIEEQAASVELPQQPESELSATGDQALSAEAGAPASMAMQVQRNLQITQRTDGVAVVGEIDNFSAIDVDGDEIAAQGPTDTLYMEAGSGITLEVVDGRLVVGATGGDAGLDIEVVQQLPQTGDSGTLYLVPNQGSGDNVCDEYVWLEASQRYEKIGTTETDLSGYVTDAELTTALADKADSADLDDYLPLAGGTLTGDLGMEADLVYGSDTAYPTFIRSSWSTSSDASTLPVTPCFVLDTSDNGLYWCSGSGIVRLNPLLTIADIKGTSDTLTRNARPAYFITLDAFADGGALRWSNVQDVSSSLAALVYKGYAKAVSADFNNITESGIYYLDNTAMSNGPSNYTWAYLVVIGFTGVKTQLVVKPSANVFAMREYSGSPATWWAWVNK